MAVEMVVQLALLAVASRETSKAVWTGNSQVVQRDYQTEKVRAASKDMTMASKGIENWDSWTAESWVSEQVDCLVDELVALLVFGEVFYSVEMQVDELDVAMAELSDVVRAVLMAAQQAAFQVAEQDSSQVATTAVKMVKLTVETLAAMKVDKQEWNSVEWSVENWDLTKAALMVPLLAVQKE